MHQSYYFSASINRHGTRQLSNTPKERSFRCLWFGPQPRLFYLTVPMNGLISGMVVVVIRFNEFIFVDATAKTQEVRHLIFRLFQDVGDNGQGFISIACEEIWSEQEWARMSKRMTTSNLYIHTLLFVLKHIAWAELGWKTAKISTCAFISRSFFIPASFRLLRAKA